MATRRILSRPCRSHHSINNCRAWPHCRITDPHKCQRSSTHAHHVCPFDEHLNSCIAHAAAFGRSWCHMHPASDGTTQLDLELIVASVWSTFTSRHFHNSNINYLLHIPFEVRHCIDFTQAVRDRELASKNQLQPQDSIGAIVHDLNQLIGITISFAIVLAPCFIRPLLSTRPSDSCFGTADRDTQAEVGGVRHHLQRVRTTPIASVVAAAAHDLHHRVRRMRW
jgi:hypothetical protein